MFMLYGICVYRHVSQNERVKYDVRLAPLKPTWVIGCVWGKEEKGGYITTMCENMSCVMWDIRV